MMIGDIIHHYPRLYDYDYKWKDSENYRDLAQVLDDMGFEYNEEEVQPGDYNDIKGYLHCRIRYKIEGGRADE